jgi:hypothetical protein
MVYVMPHMYVFNIVKLMEQTKCFFQRDSIRLPLILSLMLVSHIVRVCSPSLLVSIYDAICLQTNTLLKKKKICLQIKQRFAPDSTVFLTRQ